MDNQTRKLMKILHLRPDEVYHVFNIALCLVAADGVVNEREGELLTRIGFGLGLTPQDIEALVDNAREAIGQSGAGDVISHAVATLKAKLAPEQLDGVKQVLRFVAAADDRVDEREQTLMNVIEEIWKD